jgi:hypothetical protein
VENSVDYFFEWSREFQDFSLAKSYSILIGKTTPYLSITIRRMLYFLGALTDFGLDAGLCGVIHSCG